MAKEQPRFKMPKTGRFLLSLSVFRLGGIFAGPLAVEPPLVPDALMRFSQIDRIVAFEPGVSLTATKTLSLSEEYLKDHFPRFPVMPGVLMLEATFQAAMYLVRLTDDFAHAMVVLDDARNLKFQGFVQPGDQLLINVEWYGRQERDRNIVKLKVSGEIGGKTAMSGWLLIRSYDLADTHQADPATDRHMRQEFRKSSRLLFNQLGD